MALAAQVMFDKLTVRPPCLGRHDLRPPKNHLPANLQERFQRLMQSDGERNTAPKHRHSDPARPISGFGIEGHEMA